MNEGVALGAHDEVLRSPGAGAPLQQLGGAGGGAAGVGAGFVHEAHGVLHHVIGYGHPAHQLLKGLNFVGVQDLTDRGLVVGRGVLDDLQLGLVARVAQLDVEHEAVQLGFGQRVGAFLLDGVLGGQHEERAVQRVPLAGHRHGVFLHAFEQGRLGFGRRPVDFVGQHDVGENRPWHEVEVALLVERFRAHDVRRHQVGRELHPVEGQVQRVGNGLDEQGFGQPGHAHQQAVALRKHGRQHQLHHVILPNNDFADFLAELLVGPGQRVGGFFIGGERHRLVLVAQWAGW